MSRYIDADALAKEIKQDIADAGLTERFVFYRINEAPSIDIVRCKECTYWTSDSMMMICGQTLMPKEDDDYCSRGERRTDE